MPVQPVSVQVSLPGPVQDGWGWGCAGSQSSNMVPGHPPWQSRVFRDGGLLLAVTLPAGADSISRLCSSSASQGHSNVTLKQWRQRRSVCRLRGACHGDHMVRWAGKGRTVVSQGLETSTLPTCQRQSIIITLSPDSWGNCVSEFRTLYKYFRLRHTNQGSRTKLQAETLTFTVN